jgi:hypothetical protein
MRTGSGGVSLQFGPSGGLAVGVNLDANEIRTAADRTILDVFLFIALRNIDGNYDLLTASSTGVSRFVIHSSSLISAYKLNRTKPDGRS